jgi:hypothetical protein
VLSIWEGTTNILSLDVLRSIHKSNGSTLEILGKQIELNCKKGLQLQNLKHRAEFIINSTKKIIEITKNDKEILEVAARDLAFSLYNLYAGSLLIEKCSMNDTKPSDYHLLKK